MSTLDLASRSSYSSSRSRYTQREILLDTRRIRGMDGDTASCVLSLERTLACPLPWMVTREYHGQEHGRNDTMLTWTRYSIGLEVGCETKPRPVENRQRRGRFILQNNVTIYLCFYSNQASFMEGRKCHSIDSNRLYHIYRMTD